MCKVLGASPKHIQFYVYVMLSSVGVLEDKSSSSRILEDNFKALGLGLGLESRVLGLGLEACVLDSITVYNVCTVNVLTENLDANNFSDHSRPFPERKVVFPRGGRGGAPYNFDSLRNSFPILHAARTRPPL